eukprot:179489_1
MQRRCNILDIDGCIETIQEILTTKMNDNDTTTSYHFCEGEIEITKSNFLQLFIPQHNPSTIRYHGKNTLSQHYENTVWQSLYTNDTIMHDSSVGVGDKTVIDTKLRSSKELKSHQFQISGTSFELHDSRTSEILKTVRDCLTPNALYIIAMRYKLIVYSENDLFTSHVDTYRGDGHFGTLLLLLPTTYTGGEFVLRHHDKHKVIEGRTNLNKIKWIAFYGDVKHEIKEVTSGYRVSIAYNLYLPPQQTEHISSANRQWVENIFNVQLCDSICNAVHDCDYNSDCEDPHCGEKMKGVVIKLKHKYVLLESELSVGRLKGEDLRLYNVMKGCKKLKFEIASSDIDTRDFNRNGFSSSPKDGWERVDEDVEFAEYEYIIIGDLYEDGKHYDESGPTGNEGQSRKSLYRSSIMLITTRNDADAEKQQNKTVDEVCHVVEKQLRFLINKTWDLTCLDETSEFYWGTQVKIEDTESNVLKYGVTVSEFEFDFAWKNYITSNFKSDIKPEYIVFEVTTTFITDTLGLSLMIVNNCERKRKLNSNIWVKYFINKNVMIVDRYSCKTLHVLYDHE